MNVQNLQWQTCLQSLRSNTHRGASWWPAQSWSRTPRPHPSCWACPREQLQHALHHNADINTSPLTQRSCKPAQDDVRRPAFLPNTHALINTARTRGDSVSTRRFSVLGKGHSIVDILCRHHHNHRDLSPNTRTDEKQSQNMLSITPGSCFHVARSLSSSLLLLLLVSLLLLHPLPSLSSPSS